MSAKESELQLQRRRDLTAARRAFPIDDLDWTGTEDLVAASAGNIAVQAAESEQFAKIEVEATFQQLIQCSDLLQLALTAAGNQPCATHIVKIMSKYQDAVADSVDISGKFADSSVAALKAHKLVKKALEKGKGDLAFKVYGKCGVLAEEMALLAGGLVEQMTTLCNLATAALEAVKNDQSTNEREKLEIQKLLNKTKAEQAGLEETLQSLASELEEVQVEEAKYAAQAAEQRDRQFGLQIAGAIIGGISSICSFGTSNIGKVSGGDKQEGGAAGGSIPDVHDARSAVRDLAGQIAQTRAELDAARKEPAGPEKESNIKKLEAKLEDLQTEKREKENACSAAAAACSERAQSLEAKEAAATATKRRLKAAEREQKARLKEAVAEMTGMTTRNTQIEQVLKCLSLTFETMGQVKTTFSNVQLFWKSVARQCTKLSEMRDTLKSTWEAADDDEKELEGFEILKASFMESAVGWAALGCVNYRAHQKMIEAKSGIDSKMRALPDGEIRGAVVDQLAKELTLALEDGENNLS